MRSLNIWDALQSYIIVIKYFLVWACFGSVRLRLDFGYQLLAHKGFVFFLISLPF